MQKTTPEPHYSFSMPKKKTAKMRKVIKIFKSGNNGLFCKAYSLKFTKWSISD